MRLVLRQGLVLGMLLALAGCTPRGPEALRRGDAELSAGRPSEAIPLLEQAVTDLPADAGAWNHLGLAYHAAGRTPEAQKAYLRALQFDRNFFDAYFNLGALEFEQQHWLESERALRTYLGVERNRTNATAWRLLGETLLASRQTDAAERTLATAAQLAPQDASVHNSLGLALVQKRRGREAQAQFAQALRLDPEDASARLNLAIVTQQLGDRRGAVDHYRAYLALTPSPPATDSVRALVQQLEAQLAPPEVATNRPLVVTNLARAQTNSVPRPVTNSATAGPVRPPPTLTPATPKTNAPTLARVIAVTPPVTNPPIAAPAPTPATRPPPPVEVVRVEDSPELKPAKDPSPPPATAAAPAPEPAPTSLPQTTPPPSITPAPGSGSVAGAEDPARKTFWQRVSPVNWGNPVKWFRGSDSGSRTNQTVAATTTPRPSSPPTLNLPPATPPTTPKVTSTPETAPAVAVTPVPPPRRPPPAKPIIARYPRQVPPVLTPGNRAAAEKQAQAAAAAPDRAAALAAWQRAVQLDPAWFNGWFQTGRTALETANTAVALQAGEAAVTLEPNSAPAQQLFAAALARAGYPADAAEHLERAVTLAPGSASVHLALAGLYARDLGETALARPHYGQVLALEPQHPQAAAIRVWLANNP